MSDIVKVQSAKNDYAGFMADYAINKTRDFTRLAKHSLECAAVFFSNSVLNNSVNALKIVDGSYDFRDVIETGKNIKEKKGSIILNFSDIISSSCCVLDWLAKCKIINVAANTAKIIGGIGAVTLMYSFGIRTFALLNALHYQGKSSFGKNKMCDLAISASLFAIGLFASLNIVLAYNFGLIFFTMSTIRVIADLYSFALEKKILT